MEFVLVETVLVGDPLYSEKQKCFIPKKKILSRTAKIDPKDGVSRLNFPEGFATPFLCDVLTSKANIKGRHATEKCHKKVASRNVTFDLSAMTCDMFGRDL